MDPHYASKLLRQVLKNSERLVQEKKFWKVGFFDRYLGRAEKLLTESPEEALRFLTPAPGFAAKLAEAHPTANGADFMIQAHSYLGDTLRHLADYRGAEAEFAAAATYRYRASPAALALYLRFYAMLCVYRSQPEAFDLLGEAIAIHKRGNLVHRHELGKCLICRGIAYYHFNQPGRILGDFTAALNHLSIAENPMPYYAALHNLATYSVLYGTEDDVRQAVDNLKPARVLLSAQRRHSYAKLCMRYLLALLDFRLGKHASAELTLGEVAQAFHRQKLPFEVGLVQIDLARLYLAQGRREELRALVRDTDRLFRELGNERNAEAALGLWCGAFRVPVTDRHLLDTRARFFEHKLPMAA